MSKEPAGYARAETKASRMYGDENRTRKLLRDAYEKAKERKGSLSDIWGDLMALFRLSGAWVNGRYRDVGAKTIIAVLAALVYFLNPFDLLPDMLPFLGFLDDATIIGYVIKQFSNEINKFKSWEQSHELEPLEEL